MDARREFLITALVGGVGASVTAAQEAGRAKPRAAASVDGLGLNPEARADLEAFAEPVLRDVACLLELPIDDVDPAFVFVPRG